ncbi:MAG: hypothetical protein OEZ20_07720 [candidate division WOR-3 bacterium]|nr:hypothetical protein [candidate division WOR-3 bacterium]
MNKLIYFLLIGLSFLACEESMKFEEPQPKDRNDLNQIPRKLRGTYSSESDKTFLTINNEQIIEWAEIVTRTMIDSLDLEIDSTKINELTTDSIQIIDGTYNLGFKFLPKDSVIIYYSYRDTIFEISNEHILRRFKGHYFLNYKQTENDWRIRRLTLDRGKLSFSKVRVPEDITVLKEITELEEIKSDSGKVIGYKLKPTRRELKQLMKHSFTETKTYKKVE